MLRQEFSFQNCWMNLILRCKFWLFHSVDKEQCKTVRENCTLISKWFSEGARHFLVCSLQSNLLERPHVNKDHLSTKTSVISPQTKHYIFYLWIKTTCQQTPEITLTHSQRTISSANKVSSIHKILLLSLKQHFPEFCHDTVTHLGDCSLIS